MGLTCPAPAGLLDDEVVFDVRHTGYGGGVFPCSGFLLRSVDKAGQPSRLAAVQQRIVGGLVRVAPPALPVFRASFASALGAGTHAPKARP